MDISNAEIFMNDIKIHIHSCGDKTYINLKGEVHREDGPAYENTKGDKYWYKEGRWHRLDGPAIEWKNGNKEWYKEGKHHRLDGPAMEWVDGNKYWYISDKHLEEKEFNSWMLRIQNFI